MSAFNSFHWFHLNCSVGTAGVPPALASVYHLIIIRPHSARWASRSFTDSLSTTSSVRRSSGIPARSSASRPRSLAMSVTSSPLLWNRLHRATMHRGRVS
jgi:hypothetical protein